MKEIYLHCSITTVLELLNNFIRTRLTVESRDCNTLLSKRHTSNAQAGSRPPGIPVREFPGIAEPKIPGGNSREFMKFWRELRRIYRSFVFFPIFSVDFDILLFNLTHCIMCIVHDARWAYRFLSKTLNL